MTSAITKTTALYLIICLFTNPSFSATDSFIYGGCSQFKFTPNSPYESNLNSALTSLVNSAMSTNFNNVTSQCLSQFTSSSSDTVYNFFQCRSDVNSGDCARCIAKAVSQLGTLCLDSSDGSLQLEGCFVKYENTSFLGVEDKSEVLKRCGPLVSLYDSDKLTRHDAVLGFLSSSDGGIYRGYRIVGSGTSAS